MIKILIVGKKLLTRKIEKDNFFNHGHIKQQIKIYFVSKNLTLSIKG